VAKRCVLEQKLLLTAYRKSYYVGLYEKSIGTKMNDLDLCLEVVRSCAIAPANDRPATHCVTFSVEYLKNR